MLNGFPAVYFVHLIVMTLYSASVIPTILLARPIMLVKVLEGDLRSVVFQMCILSWSVEQATYLWSNEKRMKNIPHWYVPLRSDLMCLPSTTLNNLTKCPLELQLAMI